MKARDVGRTVEIIVRVVAAATNVFVVGDASSRDGRWSVGGEVDWQGLRSRVGCKRAESSARLSVGLGRDQVDVFVGCHCCVLFLLVGFTSSCEKKIYMQRNCFFSVFPIVAPTVPRVTQFFLLQ